MPARHLVRTSFPCRRRSALPPDASRGTLRFIKYLDDPKNVYGETEQIHTIDHEGLEEEMPEAYAILDNFAWSPEQMGEVMLMKQEEDSDPTQTPRRGWKTIRL